MITGVGMVLGTAAYMSPEAGQGAPADKRSDVWGFGCVLYEMLTGQRAFGGEDITDTLAAVAKSEPAWEALPQGVSPSLRMFLRRCLQKHAKQRLHDIADMRLALEGAFEAVAPQTTSWRGGRLAWIAFAVAAVVAAALAIPALRHLREAPPYTLPETRLDVVTPATDSATSFALSPDGRQIVFAVSGEARFGLMAAVADEHDRATADGNRGGHVSLLVARQPLCRLLRREYAEAARPRWSRPADVGARSQR